MDSTVVKVLEASGIAVDPRRELVYVGIELDEDERLLPIGEEVAVLGRRNLLDRALGRDKLAMVAMKPITQLFSGQRTPPSFRDGPTPEYMPFFATIERAVAQAASVLDPPPTDQELERLYRKLKRHPDGTDAAPLFSCMQAAARAYMSVAEVSRADFEAVIARLAQSARTFSVGHASHNYSGQLAAMFLE